MEKSAVTDYFIKYFEKNRIDIEEISEKTGISKSKFSKNARTRLTADEFLRLCVLLGIKPEMIWSAIKQKE